MFGLNLSSLSNITLFKVLRKYSTAPIVIHSHTVAFEKQGGLKDFLILMLHYYCQKKYLKAASCLCACLHNKQLSGCMEIKEMILK